MESSERKFCSERNFWLAASDNEFMNFCRIENFQDSGKGGQKRNRKYSAARVTNIKTGLSAECAEFREQIVNRNKAINKLKLKLAFSFSGEPIASVRAITSLESPDYPVWVAFVLDLLYKNSFEINPLAEKLSLSKSKTIKLLYRDKKLWDEVNNQRTKLGKTRLSL